MVTKMTVGKKQIHTFGRTLVVTAQVLRKKKHGRLFCRIAPAEIVVVQVVKIAHGRVTVAHMFGPGRLADPLGGA